MKAEGVVRQCEHPGKPHSHGYECYRFDKCRCRVGRDHYARQQAQRRKARAMGRHQPNLIDKTGSVRRLRALAWLGYTATEIGNAAGLSRYAINEYTRNRVHRIKRSHAESIARLYDELWDIPAPESHGQRYVSAQARRRGYLPPSAWDEDSLDEPSATPAVADEGNVIDYVAVKRAMDGRDVELTPAELDAAIAALLQQGVTQTGITKRFAVGKDRVKRINRQRKVAA